MFGSGARLGALVASLLLAVSCAGCGASPEDKEITEITQQYLTDQVNSVTENKQFNRNLETNSLPADRVTGRLTEQLRIETPKIALRRNQWRGTSNEYGWGRVKLVDPKVDVSGDTATMAVTESTEMHYSSGGANTPYSVGHNLEYVREGGVWKISSDELDVPSGAPLLLEAYAR